MPGKKPSSSYTILGTKYFTLLLWEEDSHPKMTEELLEWKDDTLSHHRLKNGLKQNIGQLGQPYKLWSIEGRSLNFDGEIPCPYIKEVNKMEGKLYL